MVRDHLGLRWGGPSWGGKYSFRFGPVYQYVWAPRRGETAEQQVVANGTDQGHGVGAWLALEVELAPPRWPIVPLLGIQGVYLAVVSTDPVAHQASAQVTLGFAFGRRLVFGEPTPAPAREPEVSPSEEENPQEGSTRTMNVDCVKRKTTCARRRGSDSRASCHRFLLLRIS